MARNQRTKADLPEAGPPMKAVSFPEPDVMATSEAATQAERCLWMDTPRTSAMGDLVAASKQERCPPCIERRGIARLPVPKPRPKAIAAGRFGMDKRGPICPRADEVRAITEAHAGLLIALLLQQHDAQRARDDADSRRLSAGIKVAVRMYTKDFGEHAAEQLLAYASEQAFLYSVPPPVAEFSSRKTPLQ